MLDDLDLRERFEPLAAATFVPEAGTATLHDKVARRRRRHRALAGTSAAVIVLLAAIAVAALGGTGASDDHVRAAQPDGPGLTAFLGTGPRLVIGSVPDLLASRDCMLVDEGGDGTWVECVLGFPSDQEARGISIDWKRGPASPAVLEAWDRGDAPAVAQATGGLHGPVAFVDFGRPSVLDLGEVSRARGSGQGGADRVTHGYEVRIGDSIVQVTVDAAVPASLVAEVVGSLALDPADLGFVIPADALPPDAEPIAQGRRRLWFEPDPTDPSRSDDNGGDVRGITYVTDGRGSRLDVDVVRGVDADSYVDTWGDQVRRQEEGTVDPVTLGGRSGLVAGPHLAGVDGEAGGSRWVAVAADPRTVVIVKGPSSLRSSIDAIAGRTEVDHGASPGLAVTTTTAPGAGSTSDAPSRTTTVESTTEPSTTTTVPGTGGATGWYVPQDLSSRWILDKAVRQGVDGSGQAQVWLTTPTGNQMAVTLSVPNGRAWHADDAQPHPLPGLDVPVWADPLGGDARGSLVMARPGAIVRVTWLDIVAVDSRQRVEAEAAGAAEAEELAQALRPVDAAAWRAFLGTVPHVPQALLDAPTLAALPDES